MIVSVARQNVKKIQIVVEFNVAVIKIVLGGILMLAITRINVELMFLDIILVRNMMKVILILLLDESKFRTYKFKIVKMKSNVICF